MKPEQALALHKRLVDAYPTMRSLMTPGNATEWRSWLEALPFADASRALTTVIAREDFPTIHQLLAAIGFDGDPKRPPTPQMQMLIAARDGKYELVRDPQSTHGWRSSLDQLPEPAHVAVPMPPEVREQIQGYIGRLAEKRVPPVGAKP